MPLPPATNLTRAQYSGWACVWCGKSLLHVSGAVSAGISRGHDGAHILDTEVYACPDCACHVAEAHPRTPLPASESD